MAWILDHELLTLCNVKRSGKVEMIIYVGSLHNLPYEALYAFDDKSFK